MANLHSTTGVFTFTPEFKEFLPLYKDVTRVWIGNGINTGTSGMLYAEYNDGHVEELGSVSLYATAVANGFTGTEDQWLQMIIGVADLVKGSKVSISYQVSSDGQNHPTGEWSPVPSFEKGKFTWTKVDLEWIDTTTTTLYFSAYQGEDGQVESVNGEVGSITLRGENLPIAADNEQSIKDYIDENVIPNVATNEQIDELFSMVFFSGTAFISGRRFVEGDSITFKIEALTPDAPMPQENLVTIYPTEGDSCRYHFGHIVYKLTHIPAGETRATFRYKITETSHTLPGVTRNTEEQFTSVTIINNGDGTLKIDKEPNFNAMHFMNTYTALGHLTFEGSITLNGRRQAAREFMVEIMEGDQLIARNVSTTLPAATGEAAEIAFPAINYTLDDIGTHIYTVRETSPSGDGVTVADTVYTVRAIVKDEIIDGELEIETGGTDKNLNFVNTYAASGSIAFNGNKTIVDRLFRDTDTYSVSITGNGKLPSPATANVNLPTGEDTVDFEFAQVTYTLDDMRNAVVGYDDVKIFTYTFTENANIPGVVPDGLTHTASVKVTDDKLGHLLIEETYSDGERVEFGGIYYATGAINVIGRKTLENRPFVAADSMYATISATNGGNLPYVTTITVDLTAGQYYADFNYMPINYSLPDLEGLPTKTFSYIVEENTIITGATNDTKTHTVDIQVSDNYDGTLAVVPAYSDGDKLLFESVYNATGFLGITGTKTIANRKFKNGDIMSVAISALNDGNLPNPATINVTIIPDVYVANFDFAQITYKVTDLAGLRTKTFNYAATETTTMSGTTPESSTDVFSVTVTDNYDGSLEVVPSYTTNNKVTFTNIYSASGTLSFRTKEVFTNGYLNVNPFTVRITQVTGNNSTTQATENVVLDTPVTRIADTGSVQTLEFTDIVTFVKNSNKDESGKTYWFLIEQVLPVFDVDNIYNNVRYDTSKKWISVSVVDDTSGHLIVTKTPAESSGLDMTFTNEQLSDLVIEKIWTGDDDRLTTAQKNAFTFVVTGPNGYYHSFTYADMVDGSKTLEDLAIGEYTITETNNTVENFTITTTYESGGVATNRVNLTDGNSKTITITDAVNKLEGTLTISKTWTGDDNRLTTEQKNSVMFTVSGPKQYASDPQPFSATFTYADMVNGSKTFERLTLGTYSVAESNNVFENFALDTTYSVNGFAANSVTIADSDSKTIVVNDAVNKLEGSITITTTWAGDHSRLTPEQKNGVTFTVTGPKQYADDPDVFTATFTYADMVENSKTFDRLTLGTYTVVETNNTFPNFATTVTYTSGGIETSSATIADGDSKTISIINNMNKLEGDLTITKAWAGDDNLLTAEEKNAVTFTVTGPKQDPSDPVPYSETFTYADMTNGSITLTQLTLGTYTVVESNNVVADFDLTVVYNVDNVATNSVIIGDGDSKIMAITGTYIQHLGSAKVTKLFEGLTSNLIPSTYRIVNDYNDTTFVFANADNAVTADGITIPYEWTITDIPVHTVITYTESNESVHNYTLSPMSEKVKACSPIAKNETSVVPFVNTYTLDVGTVKVTAQFSGIPAVPGDYQITNDYNATVFTYANAVNAATADGFTIPYEWLITNVPAETQITFTESNEGVTNYTLDPATVKVKTSEAVVKDGVHTVSFTNPYTLDKGYVRVEARFSSGIPGLLTNYQITNDYNGDVFTFANASNAATADGTNIPYRWFIYDIPVQTVIAFTQSGYNAPDYTIDPSSPIVLSCSPIVKDTASNVYFTNGYTYDTGSVKVTKQFTGLTSAQLPANFQIANNYNESVFTYANADNAATADGITVPYEWTITSVPVHTTITFTESNESVTNYTLDPATQKVKTCTAVTKNTMSIVDFVNAYTLDVGEVVVQKMFSGITTLPASFQITNDYNSTVFTYANASNAGTADGVTVPYVWIIANVPATTEITFTESNYSVAGYNIVNSDFTKTSSPVVKDDSVYVYYTNTYQKIPSTGSLDLSAVKNLTGRSLIADEFSFNLKDAENVTLQTKSNDADGLIEFDTINYSDSDLINSPITYKISEVIPASQDPTITYDTHTDIIQVTLVDNGDGTITATPSKNGNEIVFENEYIAP